jgi:hypothetical protein
MLSIDIIRKLILTYDVKGFKLSGDCKSIYLPDQPTSLEKLLQENAYDFTPRWDLVYYPLFLDRVVQAITKFYAWNEKGFFVTSDCSGVDVCRWKGLDTYYFSLDCHDSMDTCREEAILYILDTQEKESNLKEEID